MQDVDMVFIKLGGSLITDKDQDSVARADIIANLASDLAKAISLNPNLQIIVGHGSGSFGHMSAKKYGTRDGIASPNLAREYWQGFHAVYKKAHQLHRIVIDALCVAGVKAVSFPPDQSVITQQKHLITWPLETIRAAVKASLVPVIFGDVIFDTELGGTILSTEELFAYLAPQLHPQRILIAGIEKGVWLDHPNNQHLATEINDINLQSVLRSLSGSSSVDVTGGMLAKVTEMAQLTQSMTGLQINIFDGTKPGNLLGAIQGTFSGTIIR